MESSRTQDNSEVQSPRKGLPEQTNGPNGRPNALTSVLVGAEGFFTRYPDALIVLNEAWQIEYANPAVERVFGKPEHLLSQSLWEQWPEAFRDQIEQEHKRAFNEEVPIQLEHPSSKNGHHWIEVRVFQCEFGVVAYYRDVSTERQASELQERLAAIVKSSDDAIVSKDLNGIIMSWNRGAEELFGYRAEEIVGKPITTLAAPDVIDEIPNILDRIRRGERVDHYETKRKTKEGRILTVSLTVSPIRDGSGKIIGASKVARDITEKKLNEKALRDANAALTQANEDLSQFAHVASHDLRSPLNTVVQFAQLLERRHGEELGEGKELLGHLIAASKRMGALIEDLLLYAKVTGTAAARREPIDANAQLTIAIENVEEAIRKSSAKITHDPLPMVPIEETSLIQIFQNLALRENPVKGPFKRLFRERGFRSW